MCWYLGEFGSVSIDLTRQAFERVLGAPPPAAPRLAWTGRRSSDRARTAASAPGAGRAELKEGAAQAAPLSRPGKRKESFFKRKPLNSRSNCIRRLMSLSPRFRPRWWGAAAWAGAAPTEGPRRPCALRTSPKHRPRLPELRCAVSLTANELDYASQGNEQAIRSNVGARATLRMDLNRLGAHFLTGGGVCFNAGWGGSWESRRLYGASGLSSAWDGGCGRQCPWHSDGRSSHNYGG